MRRPIVAANWKMNLTLAEARALTARLVEGLPRDRAADVVICPASPYLFPMAKALADTGVSLGAQNLYHEPSGAFTGEISAAMVADTGAKYVILGHSERRHTIGHHEDDRMINLKVRAALAAGLTPILCIGETLAQRDAEQTLDVLTYQLVAALVGASTESASRLVIAYEPVWAIGTGRNATPEQAQQAHAHCRETLASVLGDQSAQSIRILYGGSVKPDNASELFGQPDVDGGLIGGASLKADSFLAIIKAAV